MDFEIDTIIINNEYNLDMFKESIIFYNQIKTVLGEPDQIEISKDDIHMTWIDKFYFNITASRVIRDSTYFGGCYNFYHEILDIEKSKIMELQIDFLKCMVRDPDQKCSLVKKEKHPTCDENTDNSHSKHSDFDDEFDF